MNINTVDLNRPQRFSQFKQASAPKFEGQQKEAPAGVKAGAAISSLAGTGVALALIAKRQGFSLNPKVLKNTPVKDWAIFRIANKKDPDRKLLEIEEKEIFALAGGSVAGGLAGGLARLQGGVLLAPAQGVQDGAGEQHVLLKHHGHLVAQRLHVVPAHVHAAHLYSAGVHIVQPADEVGEGGLAAACAADDADGLPAADVQVHVLEHLVAGAVLVGEADVVKVDGAVLHLGDRPLGVS